MPNEQVDVYAAGTPLAGLLCQVCQTPIMAGDEVVFCPADKTPTHADCWEYNDGCPRYACTHGPAPVTALPQAEVAENAFRCPACRKPTTPNYLRCTHCAAAIPLATAVNPVEMESAVFSESSDHRQQRLLWALLLATLTGYLAPLALVAIGIVQLTGRLGPWRYSLLRRDSRLLYYATFTLASVLTILLVVTFVSGL
jgi:hypothetical protein